jgi:hypothetical protein
MEDKNRALMEERLAEEMTSRNAIADRLIEKWSKKRGLALDEGKFNDLFNKNPGKARNLAIVLENEERHLKSLTETQISNAFNGTPQTVVKVIRLGYPNSIRGEVFNEFAMTTMKDTMYKIETIYDRTVRGATSGNVMYESTADKYASEINVDTLVASATTTFSGTLAVYPLRPYTVYVKVNGQIVASDNGSGIVSGDALASGSVNYTTGVYSIVFNSALSASDTLEIQYNENSENSTLYSRQGQVNVQLVGYDFRAHPFPIGFMWSKNAELQMDSALHTGMEDVLIQAGADELKKTLDYQALGMANSASKWTSAVEFDTDWAAAGADSDQAHSQSIVKYLRNASQKTYDALMRGGRATSYLAGAKACSYVTMHKNFVYDDSMPSVGAYKMGSLEGIPVYQCPSDIVNENDILCVYKNNRLEANDAAVTIGTYIPLYRTPNITLNDFTTQTAMAFFGDMKIQNKQYVTRVSLTNLA